MESFKVPVEYIEEFDKTIEKQIRLHENLKDLLEKKRDYIQNREIEKLSSLILEEEKVIFDIGEAEKKREALLEEIKNSLNIRRNVKAIELCEKLPQPYSMNLMMKFVKLMELINDIAMLNLGIKSMLEFENNYIELTVRLLSGNLKKETFYNSRGKHKEEASSSFLDGRV